MKIYKHVITVTVLSTHATLEESFGLEWQLSDLDYAITKGDCIGSVDHESTEEIPAWPYDLNDEDPPHCFLY